MRILVITDRYPPDATGGYERSCADVVRHWRTAGHRVTVLTTGTAGGDDGGGEDVLRILPGVDEPAGAAAAVRAVLRDTRPEVVSAWNLARVPVAEVLGPVAAAAVPVVLVVCDGWLDAAPADVPAVAAGSRVVYVSDHLRSASSRPSWAPAVDAVVPSGIDTDVFTLRPVTDRSWSGRLLYVGRMSPAKGAQDAVAALADLDADTTLHIVGSGTPGQWAAITALSDGLGVTDRIEISTGDRDVARAAYDGADVVLFPSRWAEPFGLVPLEAMARGVPVVATGTGGSVTYLRDGGNALLVPPADPAGLAAAVRRLAADPALRRHLATGGLAAAGTWTVHRLAERLAVEHAATVSAAS
ncbi:glycosyltransferase family 4 protein [Nakamurella deserti]|uniref:glycosyltransferase family 4 protein n=1 Tax=Nakamurella deserti TaxID=2164074 RepID=UPI000DBE4ECF|nr:glycosyltransferase family 4 protein [Nakamurella deserti]